MKIFNRQFRVVRCRTSSTYIRSIQNIEKIFNKHLIKEITLTKKKKRLTHKDFPYVNAYKMLI